MNQNQNQNQGPRTARLVQSQSDCSGAQCLSAGPRVSQVESEYAQLEKAVAELDTLSNIHVARLDKILLQERSDKPSSECAAREELVPMAEAIRTVRVQVERVNKLLASTTARVEL